MLFDSSSAGAFDAPSMRSSGPSASPGIGRLRPAFRAGLRMGAREWLLFRLLASSGHAAAERVREGLRLRPGYGAVRRCATGVNGAGACMASIHGHGVLEVHWGVLLASAVWPLGALRACRACCSHVPVSRISVRHMLHGRPGQCSLGVRRPPRLQNPLKGLCL